MVHSVFKADLARAAAREDWLQLCLLVGRDSNLVSPARLYQGLETPQIPISILKWRLQQSPRIKKANFWKKSLIVYLVYLCGQPWFSSVV